MLDQRLAFLLEALDRWARLVVDLRADRPERLLEVLDLLPRLAGVMAELLLQLRAPRRLLELGEHAEHLLLHRERRAELVREELSRRLDLVAEHVDPFSSLDGGRLPHASRAKPNQTRAPSRSTTVAS